MLRIGEKQELTVVKKVDFGIYLADASEEKEEKVLLPKKEVSEETAVGDQLEVFLYRDSKDRLIATRREPKLTVGKFAVLKVKEVSKIGAFLDWGLEKDLLLPFHEQTAKVFAGDECLVAMYVDKSGRLCATMRVNIFVQQRTQMPIQCTRNRYPVGLHLPAAIIRAVVGNNQFYPFHFIQSPTQMHSPQWPPRILRAPCSTTQALQTKPSQ